LYYYLIIIADNCKVTFDFYTYVSYSQRTTTRNCATTRN